MSKGIVATEKLVLFWGGWPSQWHPARFEVDAITYNCCEQFMMAEKARVFEDHSSVQKILASGNPRAQKALGRKVTGFNPSAWESVCRGIVYRGNLARFSQDQEARQLLMATGEKTIVEASPVDRIWGIGLAPDDSRATDPSQWRGCNWLGIALVQVREALRTSAEPSDAELRRQLQRRIEIGSRYESAYPR